MIEAIGICSLGNVIVAVGGALLIVLILVVCKVIANDSTEWDDYYEPIDERYFEQQIHPTSGKESDPDKTNFQHK